MTVSLWLEYTAINRTCQGHALYVELAWCQSVIPQEPGGDLSVASPESLEGTSREKTLLTSAQGD